MRITHPAHPLRGQSFPRVPHKKQKNPRLTEIQLADGERRFIPLDWTDQASPVITLPDARFLPANLLALRKQLDGLLSFIEKSGTLSLTDTRIKGGSDELSKINLMDGTARGATDADRRYSGADVTAPTKKTRKGGK